MMKDYKAINASIAEAYGVQVPDYDLTRVFEFLSAFDPKLISAAVVESMMLLTEQLFKENRKCF